jgi:hypothetical protein
VRALMVVAGVTHGEVVPYGAEVQAVSIR